MLHGIHFFLSFIFHYTLLLLIWSFSFLISLTNATLPSHVSRIMKEICFFPILNLNVSSSRSFPGNHQATLYLPSIWCFFYLCFLCLISWEIDAPVSASLFYFLYVSACSVYMINSWWMSNWMDETDGSLI